MTTNGLPIKRGEHYVQWNIYGPDFQFGVGKNLSVGVMTTWVGVPVIGTIKKSWQLNDHTQVAVGALVGTGTWAFPDFAGALPFGTISFGNRSKNIAFSAGYGAISADGNTKGRAMKSIAGMIKVSNKISLVFDSFILLPGQTETYTETSDMFVFDPNTNLYESQTITDEYEDESPGFALIIPGVRWHQSEGKAFQFGFATVFTGGVIVPIPAIQWYRKL